MSTARTARKVSAKKRSTLGRLGVAACLAFLVLTLSFISSLWAASPDALENEVKAAMIFNFTKFVDWPAASLADSKAPFVVGLVGEDDLTPFVEAAMRDKSVAGHPVRCVRMQAQHPSESCQLLLVAKSERKRGAEILRMWQRPGLLSISAMDGFVGLGGVIGIVVEDKRARFEVNIDAAHRAGLNISSKLLRLARNVQERTGGGL